MEIYVYLDDDKVGFGVFDGAADRLEVVEGEGAGAASFHLLEVVFAAHVPHEEQHLQGWLSLAM